MATNKIKVYRFEKKEGEQTVHVEGYGELVRVFLCIFNNEAKQSDHICTWNDIRKIIETCEELLETKEDGFDRKDVEITYSIVSIVKSAMFMDKLRIPDRDEKYLVRY